MRAALQPPNSPVIRTLLLIALAAALNPALAQPAQGAGQLPKWPGETLAGDGNDGVVKALQATPGAIACVSFDRVQRDQLAAVRLKNAAGKAVAASEAGFRAAIRESDLHKKGEDLATVLNQPATTAGRSR